MLIKIYSGQDSIHRLCGGRNFVVNSTIGITIARMIAVLNIDFATFVTT